VFHKLGLTTLDQECEALEEPYFSYVFCSQKIALLWKGAKVPTSHKLAMNPFQCPISVPTCQHLSPASISTEAISQPDVQVSVNSPQSSDSVPAYCSSATVDFAVTDHLFDDLSTDSSPLDDSSPSRSSASSPSPLQVSQPENMLSNLVSDAMDTYIGVPTMNSNILASSLDESSGLVIGISEDPMF